MERRQRILTGDGGGGGGECEGGFWMMVFPFEIYRNVSRSLMQSYMEVSPAVVDPKSGNGNNAKYFLSQ